MLFHTHIPKTGGTFLNYLFRSVYGFKFFQVPEPNNLKDEDSVPAFDNATTNSFLTGFYGFSKSTEIISSHYLLPTNELIEQWPNSQFIFVVRDPKKRLISDYCHKCELKNKRVNFEKWVEKRRNFQVSMLSKNNSVQEIILNIKSGKFIALTTEDLYEDIIKIFNLPQYTAERMEKIPMQNVNKGSIYRDNARDLMNTINLDEYVELDEELYKHIKSINQATHPQFKLPNSFFSYINRNKSRALSYLARQGHLNRK